MNDYYALMIVDGDIRLVYLGMFPSIGDAMTWGDANFTCDHVIWYLSKDCVGTLIADYKNTFQAKIADNGDLI